MIKKSDKKWFHNQYVEQKFKEVFSKYITDEKIVNRLFRNVLNAYSKDDRHYHNMHHIFHMVSLWETHKNFLKDADVVFFAIIYHDIVYKPLRKDNESKSAVYFIDKIAPLVEKKLNVIKVCEAITATKHNEESKKYWEADKDIQYLLDFDLDILGTRHQDTYEWYRKGVRKEYGIFPLKIYKAGRKSVLESFLKREKIYLTPEFKESEKRARKNLKNEIKLYLC